MVRRSWARASIAVVAACAAVVLSPAVAPADPVESGTLTFSGDPGDWPTGGEAYSYSVAGGDSFVVTSRENAAVSLYVQGQDGLLWSVNLGAQAGGTLTAGTTYTVTGSSPDEATLSFWGGGRSCGTETGSFTVHDVVFGPYGYVERFDASFEQRCDGAAEAARGDVHLANPTPPPALTIGHTVDSGTLDPATGEVTAAGTVTCSEPTTVAVSGAVIQTAPNVIGEFAQTVVCTPGAPVPWQAVTEHGSDREFRAGPASVYVSATAHDDDYDQRVVDEATTAVTLTVG